MSVLTKCLTCDNQPLDFLTMFKKLIVKDASGNFYLNLYYTEHPTECDDLTSALDCVSGFDFETLFKNLLIEDECGFCALSVTGNVCDVCTS